MLHTENNVKFALHFKDLIMNNIGEIVPIIAVLTGLIIPLAVFLWLYHENKNKYAAVVRKNQNNTVTIFSGVQEGYNANEIIAVVKNSLKFRGRNDEQRTGMGSNDDCLVIK